MSSVAAQVATLRGGVVRALLAAEVSGTGVLTAEVSDFRPVTWYAPPIYPYSDVGEVLPSMFSGFGLLSYNAAAGDLQEVYNRTLWRLQYSPLEALSEDRSYLALPASAFYLGEEARLVFSGPMLQDDEVSDEAAYTFALEFVAACVTAGIGTLYQGGDDFYVRGDGVYAGIRGGTLLQPKSGDFKTAWEINLAGYVESYLTMTRGGGWTTSTLDCIDRLNFWYEGLSSLPDGLDGLPEALAFLRGAATPNEVRHLEASLLGLDRRVERAAAQKRVTRKQIRPAEYFQRLDDCQALMIDWRVTDQQRIMGLFELLVPDILSESVFLNQIYDLNKPVNSLKVGDVRKINNRLTKLRQSPKIK